MPTKKNDFGNSNSLVSKTKAVKITFSLPSAALEIALELVQMSIYMTYLLVHKALSEIVFNLGPQRYLRKNRHFFFLF